MVPNPGHISRVELDCLFATRGERFGVGEGKCDDSKWVQMSGHMSATHDQPCLLKGLGCSADFMFHLSPHSTTATSAQVFTSMIEVMPHGVDLPSSRTRRSNAPSNVNRRRPQHTHTHTSVTCARWCHTTLGVHWTLTHALHAPPCMQPCLSVLPQMNMSAYT